jgi:hypothetical protein
VPTIRLPIAFESRGRPVRKQCLDSSLSRLSGPPPWTNQWRNPGLAKRSRAWPQPWKLVLRCFGKEGGRWACADGCEGRKRLLGLRYCRARGMELIWRSGDLWNVRFCKGWILLDIKPREGGKTYKSETKAHPSQLTPTRTSLIQRNSFIAEAKRCSERRSELRDQPSFRSFSPFTIEKRSVSYSRPVSNFMCTEYSVIALQPCKAYPYPPLHTETEGSFG